MSARPPASPVVLIDRDQETADKGKAGVQKSLTDRVNKGRMKGAERDALLGFITPTADYNALKDCDLVIEAVFEDRKIKADVIAKIQAVIGDKAIFGSNTSTLPITSLAAEFKDRPRFIGIHFFSPVEKMMLVELILGKKTGDAALAAALDFVRAIRKTPIVVNDSRGFYTSRVVGTYIREGHLMLTEGVPAAMIENVGRMAGMPVGPLALNDEVAVDLAWKILKATEADLGAAAIDPRQKALLDEMVEKRGRFGRKNGKGFYDYPRRAPKKLWPGLAELQPSKLDPDTIDVDGAEAAPPRHPGAGDRALLRGEVSDRRARGRCRLDPRLRLRAVLRRHAVLYRHDGHEEASSSCAERLEKKYGAALYAQQAAARDWPARARRFYGRFAPVKKRRRELSCPRKRASSTFPGLKSWVPAFAGTTMTSRAVKAAKIAHSSAGAKSRAASGRSVWCRCSWTSPPR